MSKPIRWAIIGSGNIAARFASDFAHVQGAELVGVLSRREPNSPRALPYPRSTPTWMRYWPPTCRPSI